MRDSIIEIKGLSFGPVDAEDVCLFGLGEDAEFFLAEEEAEAGGFFEFSGTVDGLRQGVSEADDAVVFEEEAIVMRGGDADGVG